MFLWACSKGLRAYLLVTTFLTALIGAFEALLFSMMGSIVDWRLFLIFNIIDGSTAGKDPERLRWFLELVNTRLDTGVDESWLL